MSLYDPTIPTGLVNLDIDYQNIQDNFSQLDITYGIDHYKYSDQTANNGFHNTVTTPLIVGSAHPTTAAGVPKLYAMQDTANIGVIQYSRGGGDAVPSPVTFIQSPATAIVMNNNTFTNVLDCTGIARCILKGYASNFTALNTAAGDTTSKEATIWWDGANFRIRNTTSSNFGFVNTGAILQLFNSTGGTLNNVYWTLQILRVQV